MTRTTAETEFIRLIGAEYLDSFIREGGAAVKVVVGNSLGRQLLRTELIGLGHSTGYVTCSVDSSTVKVHLIQRLFWAIASGIDWMELARSFLRPRLQALGYQVNENLSLDALAADNHIDAGIIRTNCDRMLTAELMRSYSLAKDFRLAMVGICKAILEEDELSRSLADGLVQWLAGELPSMKTIRKAAIFRQIARYSARNMLTSMTHWVRLAGKPGLIVVVDITAYPLRFVDVGGGNRYTKGAALDMYESLRQFIDGSDDLMGCLIVFVADREFLEDRERGFRGYEALRLRLTDDVRDRNRPNPLAPMVLLAGTQ